MIIRFSDVQCVTFYSDKPFPRVKNRLFNTFLRKPEFHSFISRFPNRFSRILVGFFIYTQKMASHTISKLLGGQAAQNAHRTPN